MITSEMITRWMTACAECMTQNNGLLTRLDAAIGDGDHGINMARGFQTVMQKMPATSETDIGKLFKFIGMTLLSSVGGASGPLYGTFFLQMGSATMEKTNLSLPDWATALKTGVDGVGSRGKANPGDKTMMDALIPASQELLEASKQGCTLAEALERCVNAAQKGAEDTIPLVARKGRASYLGEHSAGHQDPGATSAWLILKCAQETLA